MIDHFRSQKNAKTVSESDAGYNMLGTLRFAERTVEDAMISSQIEEDVRRLVDRLPEEQREVVIMRYYSGPELPGDRRPDRREHQHGAGAHALCADQPAQDDQGK